MNKRYHFLFSTGDASFMCDGRYHWCWPSDGGKRWMDKRCDCIVVGQTKEAQNHGNTNHISRRTA